MKQERLNQHMEEVPCPRCGEVWLRYKPGIGMPECAAHACGEPYPYKHGDIGGHAGVWRPDERDGDAPVPANPPPPTFPPASAAAKPPERPRLIAP